VAHLVLTSFSYASSFNLYRVNHLSAGVYRRGRDPLETTPGAKSERQQRQSSLGPFVHYQVENDAAQLGPLMDFYCPITSFFARCRGGISSPLLFFRKDACIKNFLPFFGGNYLAFWQSGRKCHITRPENEGAKKYHVTDNKLLVIRDGYVPSCRVTLQTDQQ
jgi:hypothetical protein